MIDIFNFLSKYTGSKLTNFTISIPDKQFIKIIEKGICNIVKEANNKEPFHFNIEYGDYEFSYKDTAFKTYPLQEIGIEIFNTIIKDAISRLNIASNKYIPKDMLIYILDKSKSLPTNNIILVERTKGLKDSTNIQICSNKF